MRIRAGELLAKVSEDVERGDDKIINKDQLLGSMWYKEGQAGWLSSNKSHPGILWSEMKKIFIFFYSSQNEIPRPESLASPESLLDMQTLRPQPTESDSGGGVQ